MISLDKSNSYTIGVRDQCWCIHGQYSDPFFVDIQDVSDQIGGSF